MEPDYLQLSYRLHQIVSSYDSLLDLGGGAGAVWEKRVPVGIKSRVVVDQYQPGLNFGLQRGIYTQAIKEDLLTFLRAQSTDSFDVVLAISVIEHLPKEAGVEMATEMQRVAKHVAIIYTPNGFVPQPPTLDNPHQEHLSGWKSKDLESLGYQFAGGFNGLKYLRTTHGRARLKPEPFGVLLVLFSALLTRKSKRLAFEILHFAKIS